MKNSSKNDKQSINEGKITPVKVARPERTNTTPKK